MGSASIQKAIAEWLGGSADEGALTALIGPASPLTAHALLEALAGIADRPWHDAHLQTMQRVLNAVQRPHWEKGGHVVWPGRRQHNICLHVGQLGVPAGTKLESAEDLAPLLTGTEPWSTVPQTAFDWFLKAFNLHDSSARGFWFSPWTGAVTLFIELDHVWNPLVPQTFGVFVLRLPGTYNVTWSGNESPVPSIMSLTSRDVNEAEREQLLAQTHLNATWAQWRANRHPAKEAQLTISRLDTVVGETLSILHSGLAQVLLLRLDGCWAAPTPAAPTLADPNSQTAG